MKIIVVDDEMSALQVFLEEIIEMQNVEYKFYRDSPADICSYVENNPVDAAFLDINMPGVNGIDLAERLIKISPSLKLAFITGFPFTEDDLPPTVREHTAGFLYKPYGKSALLKIFASIKNKKRMLKAEMFDTFDCFADGKVVNFTSGKSKELFALLLAYNGKTLTMQDAISQLWPNGEEKKCKILYRDAVWRLRKTLKDIGIPCVIWKRAALSVDKSYVNCDYWDYVLTGKGNYRGEFCKSYDWSVGYLAWLDDIRRRND